MTKSPKYWNKAKKYLSKKDRVMKILIERYKHKTLTTRKDIFFSLCKSIIGQQISVAAANSVFKKFKKACNGKINAKVVKKINIQKLKKCGLSRQKAKGIKELSIKFSNRSFNPKLIKKMNDEEAIIYLSTLRQIGRWSAEMILLFTFNRENIWPIQDIGLLRAISLLKIIIEEIITSIEPTMVLIVGISSQIKYPKIIAKINAKYFKGVTKETSENL